MKKSGASQGQSASELISKRIAELGDWRGETLSRMRKLIKKADPDVVEEWKWMGTPIWSHDGIICTGESYKNVVKLTFSKGASLKDPARLFNSSLDGTHAARIRSVKEKKLTSPPSRRSFAKRSPSTVLASRNLRRKRSPSKNCKGMPGTGARAEACMVCRKELRPGEPLAWGLARERLHERCLDGLRVSRPATHGASAARRAR